MVGTGGETFFSKFSLGGLEVEGFSFSSNCLLIFLNDFGSQHVIPAQCGLYSWVVVE